MDLDEAMTAVRTAQEAVDATRLPYEAALQLRDQAVRDATTAGATYVRLRELTGMSPSTISKALKRGA